MTTDGKIDLRAQEGPQRQFQQTAADIAIYGGAAGGGKSWALLLEPIRHIHLPDFAAVFFRRTTVQVKNPGGLWDESAKLYHHVRGQPYHTLEWKFPSGAAIKFAHLEYDKTVNDWQGSQIALICYDELTHFTEKQFWYMTSRNRTMCGIKPYVRATCNPDVDSWVATLIAWWIDQDTGYPIPERAGVLRWFIRISDAIVWADHPSELAQYVDDEGNPIPPKSLTFIPAKLSDNKALTSADPTYRASLLALPTVERERLLGGNWKIRAAAGLLFKREWVEVIDVPPAGMQVIRGWDFAGTPKTETNDPDATSSTKIGRTPDGTFVVLDNTSLREGPSKVEAFLRNTASQDGIEVEQSIPQDPGQAGVSQVRAFTKALAGYNVRSSTESGSKEIRFNPFSAQAEAGNVKVLRGDWNARWFAALEGFPDAKFDDDPDSTSRAFNSFLNPIKGAAYLEIARRANALNALSERDEPDAPYIPPPPLTLNLAPSVHRPGTAEWAADQRARKQSK